MSRFKEKPLFPKEIKTYSLTQRQSKVTVRDFARPCGPEANLRDFVDRLPDILAGKDYKSFLKAWVRAHGAGRMCIFGLGAHVIKVGLNPVVIDMMQAGWITALALNGAGIIHDFEVAFAGKTSEDVAEQITSGRFGMAAETGEFLNEAIISAAADKIGLGEGVGRMIAASDFPHKDLSLLGTAYTHGIPVTVHVAVGTDTIHFHPRVDGAAIGEATLRDFFLFCALLKQLDGGGIFINAGSAVLLPEVFLKAVTYIRNQGTALTDFTTAVFDFISHYRPHQNVVTRPVSGEGRGFYFVGHHEILIPLLAASLKASQA